MEQRIDLPITRAGPTVVELSASTLPGEVSTINNRAVVEINGVRDRLRVLLISGEPHPGERTWRRLLKADPSVDLVHFTILRPPEKDDLTPLNELALIAFPVRELFLDKIDEFDLIILDRFQNRGLLPMPYIANIAEHVREGGALLLSVGPEFSGASQSRGDADRPDAAGRAGVDERGGRGTVSPARHRSRPTPSGDRGTDRRESARQPRRGAGMGIVVPPHPADRRERRGAVGHADGQPLLLLDRVGKGRVALLLSDQIWLWSRGHQGGGPQAELLRRVAHWLMQEPELEENALTAQVADGRLTIERRSTDPAQPGQVTVTDPDGKTRTLSLTATSPGKGDCQSAGSDTGRVAGERRHPHCLRRGRCRQSARVRRSARHRDAAAQAGAGVGRRGAFHWHRCCRRAARSAGTAPHRARPVGRRQFVDRAGAAA